MGSRELLGLLDAPTTAPAWPNAPSVSVSVTLQERQTCNGMKAINGVNGGVIKRTASSSQGIHGKYSLFVSASPP